MSAELKDGEYRCRMCREEIPGIVEIIRHECGSILEAPSLSKSERATLMYVESRVVNNEGELDHRQMNQEDQQNLKVFKAAGILEEEDFQVTRFSDAAWRLARDCRQMRADSWIENEEIDLGDVPGSSEESV